MSSFDDSARNAEFILHQHSSGRETHYVGDSETADAIYNLRLYIEQVTDQLSNRIDHIASHDPGINPVPGCIYCEARHAA